MFSADLFPTYEWDVTENDSNPLDLDERSIKALQLQKLQSLMREDTDTVSVARDGSATSAESTQELPEMAEGLPDGARSMSGDNPVTTDQNLNDPDFSDEEPAIESSHDQNTEDSQDFYHSRNEFALNLVFFDSSVQNVPRILESLKATEPPEMDWLVFDLDANTDGVAEITDILDGITELSNIHIVSEGLHGIQLGSVTLDFDSYDYYEQVINQWSESLSVGTDAQLLVHDSQLVTAEAGGRLLNKLALETGKSALSVERNTVDDTPAQNVANSDRSIQSVQDADDTQNQSKLESSTEIVFIDSSIPDIHLFLQDIKANTRDSVTIKTVMINADEDGIDVISNALAQHQVVSAVHIISHGSDGEIALGSGILDAVALIAYENQLSGWSAALTDSADILIYGCEVAATVDGLQFINTLAEITGADVGASDDLTGHMDLGADWEIEYTVGQVETSALPSGSFQQDWFNTLDITSNLVAHYEFEEGSGGSVGDSSVNSNSGLLNDTTVWTSNAVVGSGALDLTGDAVNNNALAAIPDRSDFDFGVSDFTVSFWINSTDIPTGVSRLVGQSAGSDGFVFFTDNSGDINFQVNGSTPAFGSGYLDGSWHLVTGVKTAGQIEFFVDGVSQGTQTTSNNVGSSLPLYIGATSNNSIDDYEGLLDEVRIYDRALSGADINELLALGSGSPKTYDLSQSVPGAQTIDEDTPLVFNLANGNAITVTVTDTLPATDAMLQVRLGIADGGLRLASLTGINIVEGENQSSQLVINGTEANINAALDGLTFTPDKNFNGSVTLVMTTAVAADLQGHYTFVGGTADDQSAGIARNGTLNGNATTVVDGTRGEVLSLDGTGDYVQVNGLLGEPADITLAAWINATGVDTAGASVISLGSSPVLYLQLDGRIRGFFESGGSNIFFTSTESLLGAGWRHVAVTIDSTTQELTLYIDGAIVGTTAANLPIEYDNSPDTYIGRAGDGGGGFDFGGSIDDARIYSRALSAGEIAALAVDQTQATDSVAITVTAENDAPTFIVGDGLNTQDVQGTFGDDFGLSIVTQPDGKTLVSGYADNGSDFDFLVTRYNADGSLDTGFGTDGFVTLDLVNEDMFNKVALQDDGKIVLAGTTNGQVNIDAVLVRLNTDGSYDTSFGGGDGIVTYDSGAADSIADVNVLPNGKIVMLGDVSSDLVLLQFDANGSFDNTFGGGDGILTTDVAGGSDRAASMVIQNDGKWVVAAYDLSDISVLRYNPDGSLDTSFGGGNGIVSTPVGVSSTAAKSVVVADDGSIFVAGRTDTGGAGNDYVLVKYDTNGDLDTSFGGGDGITILDNGAIEEINSIKLQSDGKVVAAGHSGNGTLRASLVRFNVDGSPDTTFGTGGEVVFTQGSRDQFFDIEITPTDEILVVGESSDDIALARYDTDGNLDPQFNAVNTLDGNPTFVEGGSGVILDADVQIFDDELSFTNNFTGVTLTLSRNGGVNSDDSYSFEAGNGIDLRTWSTGGPANYALEKNNSDIAVLNVDTAGQLVITFTDSDGEIPTQTVVNNVLRQLTYANSSDAPPASVQIDWTFDDGNTGAQGSGGQQSVVGSTIVDITPVNDPPILALNTGAGTTIGGTVAITSEMLNEADPDDGGTGLTYAVTGGLVNGQLELTNNAGVAVSSFTQDNIDAGLLVYVHDGLTGNGDSFDFSLADGGEDSATPVSGTFIVRVGGGVSDTYATTEDDILNVDAATGLLSNDGAGGSTLSGNVVLGFDASADTDGDSTWSSDVGSLDLTLAAGVTHTNSPSSPPAGITSAFDFDGTGGATASDLDLAPGIDRSQSATFETWIRFDTLSGNQIIFDLGEQGSGISLLMSGANLFLSVEEGGASSNNFVTALVDDGTWRHIALTIDMTTPIPTLTVWVDGVLEAQRSAVGFTNWPGDAFALGTANGTTAGGYSGNLSGQVASFRIHDQALDSTEVASNAASPGGGASTPFVAGYNSTATIGNVTVNSDGSFDYDPNSQFESLATGETATDTFTYIYDDGRGYQESTQVTLTINGVNDNPIISALSSDTLNYAEGDGEAVIEQGSDAVVTDVDGVHFDTGYLAVAFGLSSDSAEDVLSVRHRGNGVGHIGVSGTSITFAGVTIGVMSGGSAGVPLTITFNASATPAAVSELVKSISYQNTDTTQPTTGARNVDYVVTDGDGGTSTVHTAIVNVAGVNDAPFTGTANSSGNEDATSIAITLGGSDPDGTIDHFVLSTLPANGLLYIDSGPTTLATPGADIATSGGTLTLYFVPDPDWNGVTTFDYGAKDDGGLIDPTDATGTITVVAVNDPPSNTVPVTQTVLEDTQTTVGGISVSDPDVAIGNIATRLEVSAGLLNVTLSGASIISAGSNGTGDLTIQGNVSDVNATLATMSYTGNSQVNGIAADTLTVTTNDAGNTGSGGALQDSDTVQIDITAVNDTPIVSGPVTAYSVSEQSALSLEGTGFSVADVDVATGIMTATITTGEGAVNIAVGNSGTAVVGGNGSSSAMLIGTLSQLNNLLTGLSTGTISYFNNSDTPSTSTTVTVTVNDGGNTGVDPGVSGDGASEEHSATQTINLIAVNDDPVNSGSLPVDLTVVEDVLSDVDLSLLNFSDVDSGSGSLSVTLTTSSGGQLSTAAGSGILLGGGSTARTLTGSLADLNNYFNVAANVQYIHTIASLNGNDADTITVSISDNGNTGSGGGANQNLGSVNVDITAANDAPVNSVPSVQTVDEETTSAITGLSVSDIDAAGGNVTSQLQVAAGVLDVVLSGSATISAGANGSADLTIQGTVADVNATIATISYTGNAQVTGIAADTLTITTNDTGNTGAGGALQDIDSVQIDIIAVNDAPVNTVPAVRTVIEDTATAIPGIAISDVDAASANVTSRLQVTAGVLNATLSGSATISSGTNGSADLTILGTVADVNATLATISYTGNSQVNGTAADGLTITTNDAGNTGIGGAQQDIDVVQIDIVAVNDAPIVTGPTIVYSVDEQTVLSLQGTGFSVTDVDAASGSMTATITVGEGAITVISGDSGVVVSSGNSSTNVTLTGTLTQINNLLTGAGAGTISYINNSDTPTATAIVTVTVNDGGNTGTDPGISGDASSEEHSATQTINVTAINDDPVNSGSLAADLTVTEDVLSSIDLSSIDFSDVDIAGGALTVTLSTLTGGQLTLAPVPGITLGGSATAGTITGSLIDLNSYFNTTNNIQYLHPTGNLNGNNADAISVLINDNGNNGSGGGADQDLGSVNIDITAVNDPPVNTVAVTQTVVEDIATAITGLSISDVESAGANVTTRLQVSAGVLNVALSGAATISSGTNGTGELTILGTVTDINATLSTVSYTGNAHLNGIAADMLTVTTDDLGNTGAGGALLDIDFVQIDITAVNDAPVVSGPAVPYNVSEQTGLSLEGTGFSVADVDAANGNLLTTIAVGEGAISISAGDSGVVISSGNHSNSVALTGTVTQINDLLTGTGTGTVSYFNNSDTPSALTTVTVTVNDAGNTGNDPGLSGDATTEEHFAVQAISLSASNDDPFNSGSLPVDLTVVEDVLSPVNLSAINVSDVDAAGGVLTVTLSTSTGGQLSTAAGTGVTSGGSAMARTLTGTLTDLNNYFDTPGNVQYLHSTPDLNGDNVDTITVFINDNGNTGNGGGADQNLGSVNVDIAAANDGPVNTVPATQTVAEEITTVIAGLSISDLDAANTNVTSRLQVSAGVLNVSLSGSATVSAGNNGSGDLTLLGTVTDINAALATLSYTGNAQVNGVAADSLTVTTNDAGNTGNGGALEDIDSIQIDITAVNDAPVITAPTAQTVTEDTPSAIPGVSVSDVDAASANMTSRLQVSAGIVNVSLSGLASITAGTNGTGDLTILGTLTDINDSLATISYTGNSNVTGTAADTLTVTSNDGGNTGSGGALQAVNSVQIDIAAVNDAPILSGIENTPLDYIENDGAVVVSSQVSISDVDDTNIESVEIQIDGNYIPGEDSLEFANTPGISGDWNASTGILTLSGTDTITAYEAAIHAVTYENTNENLSTLTRTVSITVNDGLQNSNTITRDITVAAVNDAPVLSGIEQVSANYIENSVPVGFTDSLSISDVDDTLVDSAIVSISGGFTAGEDLLVFSDQLNISGNYNALTGDLYLTGSASKTDYETAIRSIAYLDTSEDPALTTRTVDITISDGDSTSNILSRDITVTTVNDAPIGADAIISGLEDTPVTLQVADFGFTDPVDSGVFDAILIDQLPSRGALSLDGITVGTGDSISVADIARGAVVFSPAENENGVAYDEFKFRVRDADGTQAGGRDTSILANTITIDITPVSDSPVGADTVIGVSEDIPYTFTAGDFPFTDIADGDQFAGLYIVSLPQSGFLTLAGLPVLETDVIDVQQIDDGDLVFTPDANNVSSEANALGYLISDSGNTINGGNNQDPVIRYMNVDMIGINDPPKIVTTEFSVDEGSDTIISTEYLTGFDVDDPLPEDLTFTVQSIPDHGEITLSGVVLTIGDTFPLNAIIENQLRYTHDGSETSADIVELSLIDGGEDNVQAVLDSLLIVVREVIDQAPVIEDDQILLEFGETFESSTGDLLVSGFNTIGGSLLQENTGYTIELEQEPQQGTVEINPDGSFIYLHNGSGVLQDNFSYRVTNEDGVFSIATIAISIEPPIGSAFENVVPDNQPSTTSSTSGSTASETVLVTESVETEQLIEEMDPETGDSLDPVPDTPIEASRDETVATIVTLDSDQSSELLTLLKELFNEKLLDVKQHNTVSELTGLEVTVFSIEDSQLEFTFDSRRIGIDNPQFLNSLLRLDSDLAEAEEETILRIKFAQDAVFVISFSATAGLVSWVLRSGALLGSILAAAPMVGTLDPLRIINSHQENRHHKADEVEHLFDSVDK